MFYSLFSCQSRVYGLSPIINWIVITLSQSAMLIFIVLFHLIYIYSSCTYSLNWKRHCNDHMIIVKFDKTIILVSIFKRKNIPQIYQAAKVNFKYLMSPSTYQIYIQNQWTKGTVTNSHDPNQERAPQPLQVVNVILSNLHLRQLVVLLLTKYSF